MQHMTAADSALDDDPDLPHDHGARAIIDGALAILVGLLSVLQSRINGQLAIQVGSGMEAAALSFGTGLVLIAVIVAATPAARGGVRRLAHALRQHTVPRWIVLGGLGGASFVASQGLVVPTTGVALFTVAIVAGLTANSLVADRLGVGPGGRRPVTWPRIVAAAMSVAGVFIAVSGNIGRGEFAAGLLTLAFFAGALVALQQGVNGRVAVTAGSPLTAALVNFIVGFSALFVLTTILELTDATALVMPPAIWSEPLLWLGGPIGVAFVVVASFAVRGLGVLLFSLLTIVGQLAGGVLVDILAPVPGGSGVATATLVAVAISLAATVLAFLGSRRPTGTMPT